MTILAKQVTRISIIILISQLIGKRGRPESPFKDLVERTQFDKLDLLVCDCMTIKMINYNNGSLFILLDDQAVIEKWHESKLPTDKKTLIGIGENIIKLKKSLPKTSTEQTAFINSSIEGIVIFHLLGLID